jgi:hypothetical protein
VSENHHEGDYENKKNRNMIKKSEDHFIKSSKIIRHLLDPKCADVLATLIYKQEYWSKKGKLISKNGKNCFFISQLDIKVETSFSIGVIAKCLKELTKKGYITTIRQGLGKPNLYCVNKEFISSIMELNSEKFKLWQKEVREDKSSRCSNFIENLKNEESSSFKINKQEIKKTTATKNKNTKNKNTENKITNQASLVEENDLELMINSLRTCTDDLEKEVITNEVYHHLIYLVPQLKGFAMSNQDKALILQACDSEIDAWKIVDKIEQNAEYIREGKKESRFGNLFVGVREIITNYEKCLMNV